MKKLLIGLMFCLPAWAEFTVPPTPHPVNDYAGVINQNEKEQIAKAVVELKVSTGVQVGVLIVPSLEGSTIEEASMKVVESWKLGSNKSDSGVLIMLAMAEHKSRIEIGRGLEGFLTDAQSKEILVDMRPYLKRGNVGAALLNAVGTIAHLSVKNQNDIMTKPNGSVGFDFQTIFLCVFGGLGILIGIILYISYHRAKKEAEEAARARLNNLNDDTVNDNIKKLNELILRGKTGGYRGGIPSRPVGRYSSNSRSSPTIIAPVYIDNSSSYSSSSDSSSSSSSDSGSSYSSSDYSGGGGDFSGGGSSDSW